MSSNRIPLRPGVSGPVPSTRTTPESTPLSTPAGSRAKSSGDVASRTSGASMASRKLNALSPALPPDVQKLVNQVLQQFDQRKVPLLNNYSQSGMKAAVVVSAKLEKLLQQESAMGGASAVRVF